MNFTWFYKKYKAICNIVLIISGASVLCAGLSARHIYAADSLIENDFNKSRRLLAIAHSINSSSEDSNKDVYRELIKILKVSGNDLSFLEAAESLSESLWAKILDDKVIISTVGQYKIDGFILIFDISSEELLFIDKEQGAGIRRIELLENNSDLPKYIIMLTYISLSGTGIFGESVKLYAIEKKNITLALDKPYSESISDSWGAFKSDVSFEQKNKISNYNNKVMVRSVGRVLFSNSDDVEVIKNLPEELYVWDESALEFVQVQGRFIEGKNSLSEIYADYANPEGNWFQKPDYINILKIK